MTHEKKADLTERLLELIRSAMDEGDQEDEADEEAERLIEKIQAALQSREWHGRE
jgi:hypothetical protein